jgi:hypothetical protein
MLLFHGIKVPDEFDNSNWTIAFIAWLEEIKFSTSCGDLALQGKNTHVQVYQIRIFRNCNQMRACVEKIRRLQSLKIPGIGGYLASVILNVEIYVGSITKDSLVPTSA